MQYGGTRRRSLRNSERSLNFEAKCEAANYIVTRENERTFQCSLLGPTPAPSLILPILLKPQLLLPTLSAVVLLFNPSLSNPFQLSKLPLVLSGGVISFVLLFVLFGWGLFGLRTAGKNIGAFCGRSCLLEVLACIVFGLVGEDWRGVVIADEAAEVGELPWEVL